MSVEVGIPNLILVLDSLTVVPPMPNTNVPITVSVTVENTGTAISGGGEIKYYQSADSVIDTSDTPAGTAPFNPIPASITSTVTANPSPNTPSAPGTYFYGACISGTTVCTAGRSVTVIGVPNLILENLRDLPLTADTNDPIDVSVDVRNTGTAISSDGTVSYYRSLNTPITSGDTKVGSDGFTALAANGE